jgi:hypothetical protein
MIAAIGLYFKVLEARIGPPAGPNCRTSPDKGHREAPCRASTIWCYVSRPGNANIVQCSLRKIWQDCEREHCRWKETSPVRLTAADEIDFRFARQIVGRTEFSILPVKEAELLPPESYISEKFWAFEKYAIFSREWLCVAHVNEVPNVGDYLPLTVKTCWKQAEHPPTK